MRRQIAAAAVLLTGCTNPTSIPMDRVPRILPVPAPVPTTSPPTTTTTPAPTTTTTEAPSEPEPVPTTDLPPVLERIAECESGSESYAAENPSSTASGRWQVLDSTAATLASLDGYDHASDAPPHIQDEAALELFERAGTAPWAASRACWN